jgi:hypothetical protein
MKPNLNEFVSKNKIRFNPKIFPLINMRHLTDLLMSWFYMRFFCCQTFECNVPLSQWDRNRMRENLDSDGKTVHVRVLSAYQTSRSGHCLQACRCGRYMQQINRDRWACCVYSNSVTMGPHLPTLHGLSRKKIALAYVSAKCTYSFQCMLSTGIIMCVENKLVHFWQNCVRATENTFLESSQRQVSKIILLNLSCLSVRVSACNNSRTAKRIFKKF